MLLADWVCCTGVVARWPSISMPRPDSRHLHHMSLAVFAILISRLRAWCWRSLPGRGYVDPGGGGGGLIFRHEHSQGWGPDRLICLLSYCVLFANGRSCISIPYLDIVMVGVIWCRDTSMGMCMEEGLVDSWGIYHKFCYLWTGVRASHSLGLAQIVCVSCVTLAV